MKKIVSQRMSHDPRFALPTMDEMQQLRQTEGTNGNEQQPKSKSNMMELKITSLLKHVSVDYSLLKDLEKCLFTFF